MLCVSYAVRTDGTKSAGSMSRVVLDSLGEPPNDVNFNFLVGGTSDEEDPSLFLSVAAVVR